MSVFTQKELIALFNKNPKKIEIEFIETSLVEDGDHLFLDLIQEGSIKSDNKGVYQTEIQISVYCKDVDDRKELVSFIKDHFLITVVYRFDEEHEYYVAD